jgi:mxaJ protein
MFLRFLSAALLLSSLVFAQKPHAKDLRVCADPENPPFSDSKGQGFENKIAEVVGRELKMPVKFVWSRMGRGFVRNLLNSNECDLIAGIPADFRPVLTTQPYYRSSYVFVTKKSRKLSITSFDDGRLHKMKIGVQVLDEDYAPPAQALARRGNITNIVGYETTGDGADSIIRAVANGEVDVAVVWGPLAGYYSPKQKTPLTVTPVEPQADGPYLLFTYAISAGVRKKDPELRDKIDRALQSRKAEIERILTNYGVPLLPVQQAQKVGD